MRGLAGSFLVCFAIYMICTFGTSIYGLDLAYIVVGTALAYAVVTAMLGRVSGGQFNPAITVAAILTGKTKVVAGILYVIVQVVGAIAAAGAVRWILPTSQTVTMKTWLTPAVNGYGTGSVSSATTSSASVSFGISMAIVVEVIAAIIIIAVAMRHTDANGKPNATYAPVIGARIRPRRGHDLYGHRCRAEPGPRHRLLVRAESGSFNAAAAAVVDLLAGAGPGRGDRGAGHDHR